MFTGSKRPSAACALLGVLFLGACANPGQSVYSYKEVGKSTLVNFGTVVATREVDVRGKNTGIGAAVGAAGGGIGGNQVGQGAGQAAATIGGVVLGALIGAAIEQSLANRKATEFLVTLETGSTITLVQDRNEGDAAIQPGDRVMVQLSGGTQRVLPAGHLPTEIKRPQGLEVRD